MSEDVKTIAQQMIKTQLIAAMSSGPQIIEDLVASALTGEVDAATGGVPGRHSYSSNKMPFIDWLIGERIRQTAREAVHEVMTEKQDEIKKMVKEKFDTGAAADAVVEALIGSNFDRDKWRINIAFQKSEDD